MKNSVVLIAGDGENESVLSVAGVLLLPRLNYQTEGGGAEYVLHQCVKCTTALYEGDKEREDVYLRWSTTDEESCSAVGGKKLNNKMELNVNEL